MKAEIGKRYRHYKNNKEYTVLLIARLEGDPSVECVVYRAEYETEYGNESIWIRPRADFEAQIETESGIVDRFTQK
jgi:hypothetical protein